MDPQSNYEFKIRLLGNEVFAVGLSTSNSSNRWTVLSLVSIFSILTLLGAYGDKVVSLYKYLIQ